MTKIGMDLIVLPLQKQQLQPVKLLPPPQPLLQLQLDQQLV
jgi:hypothetical protein